MKKFILIVTILMVSLISNSQIKSILSTTRVVKESGMFNSTLPTKTINIQIDVEKALRETEDEEEYGLDLPYRFAKGVEVNYTLENSGDWFKIVGGRVWKLKIESAKAYSLSLMFSKLIITGSTEIYIYNVEGSMVYGPILSESLIQDGSFNSDIIKGDALFIELFEPDEEKGKSVLNLSRVVHGFRNIFQSTEYSDSYGCQDDVSCNPSWAIQSNGVTMIILANMERLCSGSLLNNGCQDFTPNILTAFHCVDIGNDINNVDACSNNEVGNGILSNQEIANAENWIFRFQYKRLNCNTGIEPSIFYTFQQANFRAGWFNTDFALVAMNQNPVIGIPGTGMRYLGWTRTDVAPTSGAFLGHPQGDVMKISTFDNATNNDAPIMWTLCTYPLRQINSPANTHWTTTINDGALEGGSSGGPFFDQNGRVVGQLHGGILGCSPKVSYAGRFDVSWIGGGSDDTRLSTWLTNDPNVTQTNTIVIPSISGTSLVCSSGATYTANNVPEGCSVSWSQSSNLTYFSGQNTNSYTVKANSSGSGWVSATINSGCGQVALPQKTVWVGVPWPATIQGPAELPNGCIVSYSIAAQGNPSTYQWSIPGKILCPPNLQWQILYGGNQSTATYFAGCQSGYMHVTVGNICGTAPPVGKYVDIDNSYDCNGMKMPIDTTIKETGIDINGDLVIYPNSASDFVQVSIVHNTTSTQDPLLSDVSSNQDITASYSVRVYNIYGILVYTLNKTSCPFTIPVGDFINGTYIINVCDNTNSIRKQFVVKH